MVYFGRPGPVCVEMNRLFGTRSRGRPPTAVGENPIYPSFSSLQTSLGASRMFNDLGLTDDQVVAGSTHPLRWLYASIDLACRAIAVRMHVNFRSRALTDEQELKLITLARYGVARFWSRN
ncbi:MAG: hypothetical protein LBE78_09180, partial [Burkholderiaceae bacterium]|nr:hypothetical protein [Burkholderiaceae bacterium]